VRNGNKLQQQLSLAADFTTHFTIFVRHLACWRQVQEQDFYIVVVISIKSEQFKEVVSLWR